MNVIIGTQISSFTASIYCNETDICFIQCKIFGSCKDNTANTGTDAEKAITLYCFGSCIIECDKFASNKTLSTTAIGCPNVKIGINNTVFVVNIQDYSGYNYNNSTITNYNTTDPVPPPTASPTWTYTCNLEDYSITTSRLQPTATSIAIDENLTLNIETTDTGGNQGSNNTNGLGNTVLFTIIGASGLALCLCIFIIIIVFHRKKKQEKQENQDKQDENGIEYESEDPPGASENIQGNENNFHNNNNYPGSVRLEGQLILQARNSAKLPPDHDLIINNDRDFAIDQALSQTPGTAGGDIRAKRRDVSGGKDSTGGGYLTGESNLDENEQDLDDNTNHSIDNIKYKDNYNYMTPTGGKYTYTTTTSKQGKFEKIGEASMVIGALSGKNNDNNQHAAAIKLVRLEQGSDLDGGQANILAIDEDIDDEEDQDDEDDVEELFAVNQTDNGKGIKGIITLEGKDKKECSIENNSHLVNDNMQTTPEGKNKI